MPGSPGLAASRRPGDDGALMDLHVAAMLFGAGIVGGVLAGLVGGASLVTFPAMLAVGLPPVVATASNLAAVLPANVIAALADRSQLPPVDRSFLGLVAASILGALIGGALLLLTPERVFEVLIPILLGFATVIFAFTTRITGWLKRRARARGQTEPKLAVTNFPMLLPISVYGGYFGSGVGVLLVAVLLLATEGDYRSANAVKNLVTGLNTLAVIYFAIHGAVNWPPTLVMAAGALIGGLMGGQLARVVPQAVMRVVVVVVGALLTAVFAYRYWL